MGCQLAKISTWLAMVLWVGEHTLCSSSDDTLYAPHTRSADSSTSLPDGLNSIKQMLDQTIQNSKGSIIQRHEINSIDRLSNNKAVENLDDVFY